MRRVGPRILSRRRVPPALRCVLASAAAAAVTGSSFPSFTTRATMGPLYADARQLCTACGAHRREKPPWDATGTTDQQQDSAADIPTDALWNSIGTIEADTTAAMLNAEGEAPPVSAESGEPDTPLPHGEAIDNADIIVPLGATAACAAAATRSIKEAPSSDGEPSRNATDDNDSGVPPPQRRVRRYYIPGLDEMSPKEGASETLPEVAASGATPANANVEVKTKEEQAKAKAAGARSASSSSSPSHTVDTMAAASKGNSDRWATATSTETHRATAASKAVADTAPVQQPSASSLPSSFSARRQQQESHVPTSKRKPNGGTRVNMFDEDDPRVRLPNALVRDTQERNKRLKTILMAALGSDFAKAGMYNDGVRTSFSVVSYQTVKQRTGLKSIPAKLLVSCLTSPDGKIDWIDVSAHPTATLSEYKEAIQDVLVGLGMHSTMIDDSTEPMLLPQVTITKECHSLLMRYAIDVNGNKRMDSFQDLTNRFTLFIAKNRVITVHRTQCTYVEELKKNWQSMLEDQEGRVARYLLYYFVKETVQTFMRAIAKCLVEFDRYEAGLFAATRARASLAREIYHIKRRAAVYGRTLTLTKDAFTHMAGAMNVYPSNVNYQEVLHDLAHMESLAEELNANADSVLQLLFQLSSYQINELMRVLTLFSAFFIPLSFIAAVYGMNFDNLPFIHDEYGEVYCTILMVSVASFIYFWFKAKHFI